MHQSIGEIARQLTFHFESSVAGTVNLAAIGFCPRYPENTILGTGIPSTLGPSVQHFMVTLVPFEIGHYPSVLPPSNSQEHKKQMRRWPSSQVSADTSYVVPFS
jgi:hypothetical protein